MRALLQALKHIIMGAHNIPRILFGSGRLVDKDMRGRLMRGEVEYPLTVDEGLCIGCGVCANICPTKCITMEPLKEKVDLGNGRFKDKIPKIEPAGCMYCFQCHDSCPAYTAHKRQSAIHPRGIIVSGIKAAELFQKEEGGLTSVDVDLCIGCGVCEKVCPIKCITMEPLKEKEELRPGMIKDKRPVIDLGKCVKCMQCSNSCPTSKAYGKPSAINPMGLSISGIKASDLFKKEGEGV
jgi:formate hydrogenlyase subunit 6/NADH:ubiquinone oxidoreductase subunit I